MYVFRVLSLTDHTMPSDFPPTYTTADVLTVLQYPDRLDDSLLRREKNASDVVNRISVSITVISVYKTALQSLALRSSDSREESIATGRGNT